MILSCASNLDISRVWSLFNPILTGFPEPRIGGVESAPRFLCIIVIVELEPATVENNMRKVFVLFSLLAAGVFLSACHSEKKVVDDGQQIENSPKTGDSEDGADLDIVDTAGNVLVRFRNGGIQVKKFNSDNPGNIDFLSIVSACKYEGKLMHVSFDDVASCLTKLFGSPHSSIYDVPFFANLKTLHETYGAVFSCYVYVERLSNVNSNYASDFIDAKSWLKWNFHTLNNKQYTSSVPINADYDLGISRLLTMVGNDKECLDHQMRGNYYELSLANAEYVRDNTTHSSYIFCAKDPFGTTPGNYYLDELQKKLVYANSLFFDVKNRVIFVQTCARLDESTYVEQSKELIEKNIKWQKTCEVLNHEWAFDYSRMDAFLNWAKNTMGFNFGFFGDIYTIK